MNKKFIKKERYSTSHTVSESEQPLLHYVQFSSCTLLLKISLRSNTLSNLDAWGEPYGGTCILHM